MLTGSWQVTWWPGVELRSLSSHQPSISYSLPPGGDESLVLQDLIFFPLKWNLEFSVNSPGV